MAQPTNQDKPVQKEAPPGFRYEGDKLKPIPNGEYYIPSNGRKPVKKRSTLGKVAKAIGRCADGIIGVAVGAIGGALMGAGSLAMHGGQVGLTGITTQPWTLHMDADNMTGFSIVGEDQHEGFNPKMWKNQGGKDGKDGKIVEEDDFSNKVIE